MESEALTAKELELIRAHCEAVPVTGINWPLAVLLFPPDNEEEHRWKERMLVGIQLVSPGDSKR